MGSTGERIQFHRLHRAGIRVAIADGEALVRAGFRALLEGPDGIEVVGEAGDGEQAVALADRVGPDVMLIDVALPGAGGLETTRLVLSGRDLGDLRVIVLGRSESDDHLLGSLRAGASGFLLKDTQPRELVDAVLTVAHGDALLSRSATRRLIAEIASRPGPELPQPEQLEELTAREREVMSLVAAGLSNHEIAERLVLSVATAKTHVSRALRKVDARDRAQLVALAYQTGLVPLAGRKRCRSCKAMSELTTSALAQELQRQSVHVMDCSIPQDLTIDQWRVQRTATRRPPTRRWRLRRRP